MAKKIELPRQSEEEIRGIREFQERVTGEAIREKMEKASPVFEGSGLSRGDLSDQIVSGCDHEAMRPEVWGLRLLSQRF